MIKEEEAGWIESHKAKFLHFKKTLGFYLSALEIILESHSMSYDLNCNF